MILRGSFAWHVTQCRIRCPESNPSTRHRKPATMHPTSLENSVWMAGLGKSRRVSAYIECGALGEILPCFLRPSPNHLVQRRGGSATYSPLSPFWEKNTLPLSEFETFLVWGGCMRLQWPLSQHYPSCTEHKATTWPQKSTRLSCLASRSGNAKWWRPCTIQTLWHGGSFGTWQRKSWDADGKVLDPSRKLI